MIEHQLALLKREFLEHRAIWNETDSRIDMFLTSRVQQTVTIAGEAFAFDEGEMICTEYSHKYTIDQFAVLASAAGFDLQQSWTDDRDWFAVVLCRACD